MPNAVRQPSGNDLHPAIPEWITDVSRIGGHPNGRDSTAKTEIITQNFLNAQPSYHRFYKKCERYMG